MGRAGAQTGRMNAATGRWKWMCVERWNRRVRCYLGGDKPGLFMGRSWESYQSYQYVPKAGPKPRRQTTSTSATRSARRPGQGKSFLIQSPTVLAPDVMAGPTVVTVVSRPTPAPVMAVSASAWVRL